MSPGGKIQQDTNNDRDFWSALMTTSWHKWARSGWWELLCWTWYLQTRKSYLGPEGGCGQPWQWPWDEILRSSSWEDEKRQIAVSQSWTSGEQSFSLFRAWKNDSCCGPGEKKAKESWLIFWRITCSEFRNSPFLQAGVGGLMWTSWSSVMPSARSCTVVRAVPSNNMDCMTNCLRVALQRRIWGYWWIEKMDMSWQCVLVVRCVWSAYLRPQKRETRIY